MDGRTCGLGARITGEPSGKLLTTQFASATRIVATNRKLKNTSPETFASAPISGEAKVGMSQLSFRMNNAWDESAGGWYIQRRLI